MSKAKLTYHDVARKFIETMKKIKRFSEEVARMNSSDKDGDQIMIGKAITETKHQFNNSCIRSQDHLHISLYLIPKTGWKKGKPPDGTIKEHPVTINTLWEHGEKADDLDDPGAVDEIAEFLKNDIFIRVYVTPEDNAIINSTYKNANIKMPPGWKFGDYQFVRYVNLKAKHKTSLDKQLAKELQLRQNMV